MINLTYRTSYALPDAATATDGRLPSVPELNLLSLAFLPTPSPKSHSIAIIHVDYQQRMQLVSHDLDIENQELKTSFSTLLSPTILSPHMFPTIDAPLTLVTVLPFSTVETEEEQDDSNTSSGGVLILGSRSIVFYSVASKDKLRRHKDKQTRQEKRKASGDQEVTKALEKDRARGNRRVKPDASVKWPWSEVTAWVAVDGRSHLR